MNRAWTFAWRCCQTTTQEETERPVSIVFSSCQLFRDHSRRTIWQRYIIPARLNTSLMNKPHKVKRSYRRLLEDLGEKVTLSHISLRTLIEPAQEQVSVCEKRRKGQKKAEGLLMSLTTSFSPKGCSIVAMINNDCGFDLWFDSSEPCAGRAGG